MEKQYRLSAQALKELRAIAEEEYEEQMTDEEIEEMGLRLLRFFSIIYDESLFSKPIKIKLTERESKALRYIHQCIYHDKKQPTVRGITQALGLRSSRSGFKILNSLIGQDIVYRDEKGNVCIREDL